MLLSGVKDGYSNGVLRIKKVNGVTINNTELVVTFILLVAIRKAKISTVKRIIAY